MKHIEKIFGDIGFDFWLDFSFFEKKVFSEKENIIGIEKERLYNTEHENKSEKVDIEKI